MCPSPTCRHVYLLIEFQSRVDSFMAVRVLAYVALLYQDLIRARETSLDEGLPAILPVVLHNGSTRWRAARTTIGSVQPQRTICRRMIRISVVAN
jgi:putative YhgA-like transposase